MIKKNVGNKAVLKAITVGLAAVMATAQPMMVLAADGPDDNTPSTGSTELKDVENGVADAAQTAAGEAADAIGVNDTTVKTDDTAASKSCDAAASAVLADLNAGEAKAASTAVVPKNESAVKDAAQALADDETIEAAAANVEDVKDELIKAENAVVASNEAAEDVVDNAVAAANVAVAAESEVDEAIQKAEQLINEINNAPNENAARQAYAGVQKLVTDTTTDLGLKRQAFDTYSAQYATARQELLNAESTYNGAMSASSTDAANAKAKLEEAQAKVEALEGQVNAALSDIQTQNAAAFAIIDKLDKVDKNCNFDNQRELFKSILQNYPGMIEENAENITIEDFNNRGGKINTVQGDNGKYHYFKVTYTVGGETRVKYYNYDRDDKQKVNEDGKSKGIIIYEKTQEEIDATIYLKAYLDKNKETYAGVGTANHDDYTVYTYQDAEGNKKYILKKELAKNAEFVGIVENGKTVYYAKNGEGVTDVKVSPVAEPTDAELQALAVGDTKSSVVIDDETEPTYYVNKEGKLVKEVKGDYVTTTYTREVTEAGTNYTKERPTNVLSEAEKNALITKVQADLALALPEGQSVTLKFAEVKDAESNDTYYELTGSYVPLFKIQINKKEIDEFADDNDGSGVEPYWVKTGEINLGIFGKKETGYYTAPILTNHTSEKVANGYNTFLQRIKDAGYTITTNGLQAEMYDDGWNYGCEEIYVWGNVEYTKDGVASITGIKSGEYTSPEAALEGLYAAIQDNLATDGVNGDLTVRTIDHLGEAKTVKVNLILTKVDIPYWYDPYDVVRKDKTFTATESYTNVDYTTDSYKKYAAYVEYVKAVVNATQEGQVLSETTYANAERMLEVMINKNNKYNGGNGYLDTKNDEEFNKFVNDAKNLLDQYKGYQTKIATAKTDIATAEEKVGALQDAIEDIKTGKVAGQRVTLGAALTNLQIPEKNWAEFLGLAFERNEETGDGVVVSDLTEDFVINEGMFKEILNMPVKDALEILDGILKNAESKLGEAEANLEVLNGKLTDAGAALSIALDRLNPGGDDDTDDDDDTTGTPGIVRGNDEGTNLTGTFAGGAGAGGRRVSAGNAGAANGNAVTINNGQVPLSNGEGISNDEDVVKVDGKEIKDNKTPLAAVPVDEQKTSLWWLALAALAAATGAGSYKYYDNAKKKKSASAKNTEE